MNVKMGVDLYDTLIMYRRMFYKEKKTIQLDKANDVSLCFCVFVIGNICMSVHPYLSLSLSK